MMAAQRRGRIASVRRLSVGSEVKMPLQEKMSRAGLMKRVDVESGAGIGREAPGQTRLPGELRCC